MEVSNKQNLSPGESGQSIFEVVVAMGLISLVLITLVSMASISIVSATFSRNQTVASRYSQQAAEWLRAEKDSGWVGFRAHASTSSWCLDSLYWQKPYDCSTADIISGTIFTRSLSFRINVDGSVQADVVTSWVDARGTHTAPTSVVFANWR